MTMLHHLDVFLHALPRQLSFWKKLRPHHLEHLVGMEQQTDFFPEIAEVPAQGHPLLSM